MAKQYICALRNKETGGGTVAQLFFTDPAAASKFAKQYNRAGLGVYRCIGHLKDDAARRCKEAVAEIHYIICDLDLRNIEQPREEVIKCLNGLVLEPTEIRDSGNGLHAIWYLKEPVCDEAGLAQAEDIMKRLATLLAGDP